MFLFDAAGDRTTNLRHARQTLNHYATGRGLFFFEKKKCRTRFWAYKYFFPEKKKLFPLAAGFNSGLRGLQ